MCRSIQTLYHVDPPATEEEIRAAAVQYVRKISGYARPSQANAAAFEAAVAEIAAATTQLLSTLQTQSPPRDRLAIAARTRAARRSRDSS